jgi:hypothetical protein
MVLCQLTACHTPFIRAATQQLRILLFLNLIHHLSGDAHARQRDRSLVATGVPSSDQTCGKSMNIMMF